MRILIEQGAAYGNLGDEAMLIQAVDRLRRLWPSCEIVVAAESDAPLPKLQNVSRVISAATVSKTIERDLWYRRGFRQIWKRCPDGRPPLGVMHWWINQSQWWDASARAAMNELIDQIHQVDLCYMAGAANINDWAARACALPKVMLAKLFHEQGKPVVVAGQTLGPIKQRRLQYALKQLVDHASLISVRDPKVSQRVAVEVGVDCESILITGDEAFELRPTDSSVTLDYLGQHGLKPSDQFTLLHLRRTNYVGELGVDHEGLHELIEQLRKRGPVLLCPMSYWDHSGLDESFAHELAQRYGNDLRVGQTIRDVRLARGLVDYAQQVWAVSYHLQVFAMAAGKPFGCLVSGDYYRHKAEAVLGWVDRKYRFTIDFDQSQDIGQQVESLYQSHDAMNAYLRKVSSDIVSRQRDFESMILGAMSGRVPLPIKKHEVPHAA